MTEIVDARAAGVRRRRDPAVVARAAALLRAGEVVVLPTDTVYGLAALPTVPGATDRLFALKGRGGRRAGGRAVRATPTRPWRWRTRRRVGPDVRRIADRLWPGPLTLVLPRRPGPGYALGQPADTVGVRCPDHALVRALAAEVGPLATTSANRHGEPTPPTAAEVAAAVRRRGRRWWSTAGRCDGAPSTVVDATGPGVAGPPGGRGDPGGRRGGRCTVTSAAYGDVRHGSEQHTARNAFTLARTGGRCLLSCPG